MKESDEFLVLQKYFKNLGSQYNDSSGILLGPGDDAGLFSAKKNDLISVNQIGFMTCTSDHIYLLQTIIEKVVKRTKDVYMLFLLISKKHTIQLTAENFLKDSKT